MSTSRICFVASVQSPFEVRMFHREAKALQEAGYEVTIVAQHDGIETVDGIRIVGIGRPASRLRRILRTYKLFTAAWAQNADVYQVQNPELIPWGILLRLTRRAPVVYDVHEDFPGAARQRTWIPRLGRVPVSYLVDVLERCLARLFTAIIAADRQIAARFTRSRSRLVTVHNYPRLSYVRSLSPHLRDDLASRTIVHAGSLSRDRGGDIMLDAFRRVSSTLPDARLLLISDFSDGYAHDLKTRVLSSEVSENVSFVDYLPHEEVLQAIARCAVGISLLQPVPKFMKNIPQKVFEYMACGVPCVVSDLPPIHDYIATTASGTLVDPRSVDDIADAIIYLLKNPDVARKMGERGREAILTSYNWETESKRLLELYECLISGRNRS